MDFSVRLYQSGDDEGIVQLLNEAFSGWPKFDLQCSPLDHWRWKYKDNPSKITIISLAESNNKIIGCFHVLPQRLKIGDDLLLSANGVDTATHLDFRGMGVYNKFRPIVDPLELELGIKFHYGIETNPILLEKVKKNNWSSFPYSLENMVRIRDISLHLTKFPSEQDFIKKYGFYTLKLLNKFKKSMKVSEKSYQDFKISGINRFDGRIDAFWDQIKEQYKFIVARDRDYLNWRYCDPRGGNYRVKIAEAQNQILGYIVLRINKYNLEYPVGYIVDLLTLPGHINVAGELAVDAINYFDRNNINKVQLNVLKTSSYESMFQRMGFINNPIKPYLLYSPKFRNNTIDGLYKCDVNNVHFVYGDYDYI